MLLSGTTKQYFYIICDIVNKNFYCKLEYKVKLKNLTKFKYYSNYFVEFKTKCRNILCEIYFRFSHNNFCQAQSFIVALVF